MNPDTTGPVRSDFTAEPDFRELLEEFAAAMPVRRDGLVDAHRHADYDLLQTRAHQLKGAGGGFGFPILSQLAADLEQACQGRNPAKMAEALEAVVRYLNRITV